MVSVTNLASLSGVLTFDLKWASKPRAHEWPVLVNDKGESYVVFQGGKRSSVYASVLTVIRLRGRCDELPGSEQYWLPIDTTKPVLRLSE